MHPIAEKPLHVYRTARGWRIFTYLFMPPLTLFFLWLALVLPFQMERAAWFGAIVSLLGLAMAALLIYGLLDVLKGRLEVYADRLVLIDPFQHKELLLSNISGFRANGQYTFIYAREGKPRLLRISAYLGNYQAFKVWLYQQAPDLDLVESVTEKEQLLQDTTLGRTPQEREQRLKEARKMARMVNGAGFLVGLWLVVFPVYYDVAIAVGLLFPLLLILMVYFYRGLFTLNEKKSSAYPSFTLALTMPALGLALRALLDINLLAYSPLVPTAIGFGLIPFLLMLGGVERTSYLKKSDYATLVALALFFAAYGWGAAVMVNCLYDETSTPSQYKAEVLEKRTSSGKTTSYYLKLSAWGPRTEAEEVSVARELYQKTAPGQHLTVYVKPGLLQAPWFVLKPHD